MWVFCRPPARPKAVTRAKAGLTCLLPAFVAGAAAARTTRPVVVPPTGWAEVELVVP